MICNSISFVFTFHWTSTTSSSHWRGTSSSTDDANDRVRRILANHIWRVDHVELLCRILACKSQNGKFTTRMVCEEIGDIQNLAVQHDPTRRLAVVLGNLFHGDATVTATRDSTPTAATAGA